MNESKVFCLLTRILLYYGLCYDSHFSRSIFFTCKMWLKRSTAYCKHCKVD